jgi:hypothetical protein
MWTDGSNFDNGGEMFLTARKTGDCWHLRNAFGHAMLLPSRVDFGAGTLAIGSLGTRFDAAAVKGPDRKPLNKSALMTQMLHDLGTPLYVIDCRRNGVGAQSAWSPEVFATQIPAALGEGQPYAFVHLPILAPSIRLLGDFHGGKVRCWQDFRDRYNAGLDDAALDVAQAFVEAAATARGMAVFLCAESFCSGFDSLAQEEQNALHCHRFSLAHRLAARLYRAHPAAVVERVDLDVAAYARCLKAGQRYEPAVVRL